MSAKDEERRRDPEPIEVGVAPAPRGRRASDTGIVRNQARVGGREKEIERRAGSGSDGSRVATMRIDRVADLGDEMREFALPDALRADGRQIRLE